MDTEYLLSICTTGNLQLVCREFDKLNKNEIESIRDEHNGR
jgi:hypothetical protein